MFEKWFELGEQPLTQEDAEWDEFVASHPHGSILQMTSWARLKNRFGWSSERVWLKQDGRFVAGAQVLYRSAGLGMVKIGYVPHGPLVDWNDDELIQVLLNQIDFSAYQRGVGFLKMEPLVWQKQMTADRWQALCTRHELLRETDTIQPPRTIMVDLTPDLDDIMAAMKQKTRYNIRLSGRKGITVRHGAQADVPIFNRLVHTTAERDNFSVHAPDYYKAFFELFAPDYATLIIAEYEGQPLAAAIISALGQTATYLYGASSNAERQRMPTYAVQWEAVRWAKARGCAQYDLWGIPDAAPAELEDQFTARSDGLWSVYRAKRGYGGEVQRTVGPVDRIYNQRTHKLYHWWRNRRA